MFKSLCSVRNLTVPKEYGKLLNWMECNSFFKHFFFRVFFYQFYLFSLAAIPFLRLSKCIFLDYCAAHSIVRSLIVSNFTFRKKKRIILLPYVINIYTAFRACAHIQCIWWRHRWLPLLLVLVARMHFVYLF